MSYSFDRISVFTAVTHNLDGRDAVVSRRHINSGCFVTDFPKGIVFELWTESLGTYSVEAVEIWCDHDTEEFGSAAKENGLHFR